MGKSVNKCCFIGNLGDDPVVRYLPNDGDAVCQFSLATSAEFRDKQTGNIVESTEWHNMVAFKKKAEVLGEYLKKGSKVYVEAKHRTRKYSDENGIERYWSEFVVLDFTLLGNARERQAAQPAQSHTPSTNAQTAAQQPDHATGSANAGLPDDVRNYLSTPPAPTDSFDDDIPF